LLLGRQPSKFSTSSESKPKRVKICVYFRNPHPLRIARTGWATEATASAAASPHRCIFETGADAGPMVRDFAVSEISAPTSLLSRLARTLMWKLETQPKNSSAYVPDLSGPLPQLKVYPLSSWEEFFTPEYLEPFSANAWPHDVLKLPTARLNGHPRAVQFYRNHETPDTALFGNFEPCPNLVTVSFGQSCIAFTNSESAFQAAKVDFMFRFDTVSKPQSDVWIEALRSSRDGETAWPTIKRINAALPAELHERWSATSRDIMLAVVTAKFSQNPVFAAALVSQRGKAMLENSGDQAGNWSISPNRGYAGGPSGINWLGNALMEAAASPAVVAAAALSPIASERFTAADP
jgi:predicted NAD-dependent protein-ADP-ribosyltransferase YbiA (DUF1768 family)